jgi:hypothetical protein
MSRSPIIRSARGGTELRAVKRDQSGSEQSLLAAEQHECPARPHDSRPVLPPEVRNRLEVRSQPSQQPHELNITPALAFQLAAGAHLVEVSIDVELKKIARVITGSTRSRRNRTHETQADHVKAFGEGINHPDRCFSPDIVVYPCRQEARLLTVLASNIAHGKDRIVVDAAFST